MKLQEINQLIDKYLSGKATREEIAILEQWYEQIDGRDLDLNEQHLVLLKSQMKSAIFSGINDKYNHPEGKTNTLKKSRHYLLRWAAAAVLLIITSIALYNLSSFTGKTRSGNSIIGSTNIAPGGNNAILTLSDGSNILLNRAEDGQIPRHQNITINREEGLLTYKNTVPSAQATQPYNTITTPRGGTYTVLLSDGTKIWLNAASSLKYPTVFNNKYREVTLTGEAYFEVAKNPAIPFRVSGKTQTIEVLGTHFNVNSYSDQRSVKTTLLEGSVKVIGNGNAVVLKPGQQSELTEANEDILVSAANTEEAVAWKNGFFQFENANVQDIMAQISRWYNIDVVYQGKISGDHYKGKVRRDANISQALKILETSGINFKIEGRTIIVK